MLTGVDTTPVRRSVGQEKGLAQGFWRGALVVLADWAGAAMEGTGVRDGMGLTGRVESGGPSRSAVEAGKQASGKLGIRRSTGNTWVHMMNTLAETMKGREHCEPAKTTEAERGNIWD